MVNADKVRILHVLDKINVNSGVSSVVMNYYDKLDHDKLTFDFMVNEDVESDLKAYIESNGSKVYVMPELKTINTLKYIKCLRDFYKNTDYKIIHGHVANSAIFYLGLARNVPFRIVHSHNTKPADIWWKGVRNWILTRFIKFVANRYIACSNEAAKFLFGKKNTALVLNNAIDVDKFIFNPDKRKEIRDYLSLEDKLVIGHVGRFSAQKNHSFLIDVFFKVYKKNNNAVLMLIGTGELLNKVMQNVKSCGLKDAVLFLGTKDNVYDYMNAMDMFVLPSLFEGFPIACIEAQTSGLRVLASSNISNDVDITGVTEFIDLNKALWVQELLNSNNVSRLETGLKVKHGSFDVETQVERLGEYYETLLR